MATDLKNTIDQLFAARGGEQAFRSLDKLIREAAKGSAEARAALIRYMTSGRFDHVREHAAAELSDLTEEGDADLVAAFRKGLSDDATRHWSIAGYVMAAGRDAYNEVVAIAIDEEAETEHRAQAIKSLAAHSGQPFDRGLPEDAEEWEPEDLRTDEVRRWAKQSFPAGESYAPPERHSALDKPKTRFEKAVAALDKRLARLREESQDPANPSNWLTPADPTDLKAIKKRWKKLPEHYLDFLTRFSPLNVGIPEAEKEFAGEVRLLGAAELIEGQAGYATDGRGKPLAGWPKGFLVVATADGDPCVLDLSESDGEDAPVLTAVHGVGDWQLERVADSFEAFLRGLSRKRR